MLQQLGYYLCFHSIDATNADCHGRFVNDSSIPNCTMKVVVCDSVPHLCLYALSNIGSGQELRYNYGVAQVCGGERRYTYCL